MDTEIIIIYSRNSEVSFERISVCNVTEQNAEHDGYCLPCSNTNEVIDLLPYQLRVHTMSNDVIEMSLCKGTKHKSW